jgi:transcription antitermination factor NusG
MNDVGAARNLRIEGWFVIWTESRAEKRVANRLEQLGLEAWLPTVTERRRWSDRWRDVVIPLFPSYLFAHGHSSQMAALLRTPGVLTVVKHAGRPVLLVDEFVSSLRRAIEGAGQTIERISAPFEYGAGDEVVVQEGPLAGVRGVVQEQRGRRQLLIWVREIGRGAAFTIGSAMVVPSASAYRAAGR